MKMYCYNIMWTVVRSAHVSIKNASKKPCDKNYNIEQSFDMISN